MQVSFNLSSLAAGSPSTPEQASLWSHDQHQASSHPTNTDGFQSARLDANNLRAQVFVWSITPQYSPPTCKVDRLLCDLIDSQKHHIALDQESSEFSHKSFPSVSSLLNLSLNELDKPVASTIAKHVAGVVRVHTLPEKLAVCQLTQIIYFSNNVAVIRRVRPHPMADITSRRELTPNTRFLKADSLANGGTSPCMGKNYWMVRACVPE